MNKRKLQMLNEIEMQINFLEAKIKDIDKDILNKESIYYSFQKPLVMYNSDDSKFNKRLKTHKKKIDFAYTQYLTQIRKVLNNQLIYLKIQFDMYIK